MRSYIDKRGKEHKHLFYMGGDFVRHRDENNKPLKCCKQKKVIGVSGKMFTACLYTQWLGDLHATQMKKLNAFDTLLEKLSK